MRGVPRSHGLPCGPLKGDAAPAMPVEGAAGAIRSLDKPIARMHLATIVTVY